MAIAGDCSEMANIKKLINTAVAEFGCLDTVVANAGIPLFGDFLTHTPEAFNAVMKVNITDTFF